MSKSRGKKNSGGSASKVAAGSLRGREWKRFVEGPDPDLLEHLYVPALGEAIRYDRCCAYFSSSVLAAAARGFAKLIERLIAMDERAPRPAVRLIVNEELPADDVRAMTETGDLSRLEKLLKKRFKNPKDLLEKRRLQMLAWLVKEGLLEVRVGVMRHGEGIVHSKYGIVTDEAGDAIVFVGSGNESSRALVANYEEVDVSASWQDEERHRHYVNKFKSLWEDRHAYVHTVALPEALRLKLIKLAPEEPPVQEPMGAMNRQRLAMLWRFIVEAPYLPGPEGAAACDATGMVGLWPHQRRVVEETAAAWPNGRLLCDEVGLGKTIEAIYVLRRLMAGRGVRRALILVPKNLVIQWQGELREKGALEVPRLEGLQTLVWPDETRERVSDLGEALCQDLLVMSRETARLENNLAVLLEAEPWDLVLLDEAHAARRRRQEEGEFNPATLLLNLLRQLQLRKKARGILLLSATPMQTHPWEPWDLLATLGEGNAWLAEFSPVRDYYRAINAVEHGRCDLALAERAAGLVAADPDFPKLPDGTPTSDASTVAQRLAFASGSERDELAKWLRRGSPLARKMHRNSRNTLRAYHRMGLLDAPPPRRVVDDLVFDYEDQAERKVYESITDYIDRRFEDLEKEKAGKGFVMTVYRRRASSSPLALRRSLERRKAGLERVANRYAYTPTLDSEDVPEAFVGEDLPETEESDAVSAAYPQDPQVARDELSDVERLLGDLAALGERDSKRNKFYEVLRSVTDDGRPALVFTEYWDTLDYLREALLPWYGGSLGCYSGKGGEVWDGDQWRTVSKDAITRALHDGQLQVLICTDAASEGLNLQAAGALINYDLPWNPSRVEQRVGRIDRIGQCYPVVRVVNLFLEDSVDEKVYRVLRARCGLFEHFVGSMQPVLAKARRMLTGSASLKVNELEAAADELKDDPLPQEMYLEAEAEEAQHAGSAVSLPQIIDALHDVDGELGIRVRKSQNPPLIDVTGLRRRKIQFAPSVELLEHSPNARPLSPFCAELRKLAGRLYKSGERLPLVVESTQHGQFRASAAYWVERGALQPLTLLSQLRAKLDAWDGAYPDPAVWHEAVQAARSEAEKQALEAAQRAVDQEREALERQVGAARLRLIRELGRYLACLGAGPEDLNRKLYEQMNRDMASSRRLRRCLDRLGDYPEWTPDLIQDLERFVAGLSENQRQARLLGAELDAAIDDPRWLAVGQ